jgi:3-dehydrosphinganine reductase
MHLVLGPTGSGMGLWSNNYNRRFLNNGEVFMELKDKVVFITGGSSGIGLACAKLATSQGASVAIFARDSKRLSEAIMDIKKYRVTQEQMINAYRLDVSDNNDVECIMEHALREVGDPFILVNSAGLGGAFHFEDLTYTRFDDTMKINVYGMRNTVAALLPFMKKSGGHIVNISSIGAVLGVFGDTAYSASKFAVIGFSECLRAELKRFNINVSVLCPPDTDTPMMRNPDTAKPLETVAISGNAGLKSAEYVAAAMYKGLERKRFIIIPGISGKLIYLIKRFIPALPEAFMDRTIRKIQRNYR